MIGSINRLPCLEIFDWHTRRERSEQERKKNNRGQIVSEHLSALGHAVEKPSLLILPSGMNNHASTRMSDL